MCVSVPEALQLELPVILTDRGPPEHESSTHNSLEQNIQQHHRSPRMLRTCTAALWLSWLLRLLGGDVSRLQRDPRV